jgi:hypothetical protein
MPKLPRVRNPYPAIIERIHAHLSRPEDQEVPERVLRISRVGECVRLLWAERRGIVSPTLFEPRMRLLFRLGNVIEEEVVELLKATGYPVTGRQKTVTAGLGGGYALEGHIDGKLILNPKREVGWTLLEVKSSNARRFDELESVGYEAWNARYGDQIHAYMGAGNFPNAIVIVYCKDDSRLYVEKIWRDAERFERLRAKALEVLTSEKVPDRPAEATSEYCQLCKYCDARSWCWGPLPDAQHVLSA